MNDRSARISLAFSCIGHGYMHLFTAFYFVIVLALETAWELPYHELLELWTLGALLVGLGALPAGWLGDRWRAGSMMVLMFLGMGAASLLCGLADGPVLMLIGLSGVGLFASIYHPVGIAWLVRNATDNRGKILGLNGIFGGAGVALAGVLAGALIDVAGWRAAFIVPGLVSVATGLGLIACLRAGWVRDVRVAGKADFSGSRGDILRVFSVLLLTMFLGAIIYQGTQIALPKVFDVRLSGLLGDGAFGVGALVAVVYGASSVMQVVGGHFADRYPLKPVYLISFLIQVPLLMAAASLTGLSLVGVAVLMVVFSVGGLPAENMLLARHAPERHHGLAFGVKFVLAFGAAPLALLLVSAIHEATGEFFWLFAGFSATAAVCMLAALLLPGERPTPAVLPAE